MRRLKSQSLEGRLSEKKAVVLRLNEQYPGDVGVLSAFFLNLVRLRPGQVTLKRDYRTAVFVEDT